MNPPTTLREAIEAANSILIGAGAGLSAADGDHHSGLVFTLTFATSAALRTPTRVVSTPSPRRRSAGRFGAG